MATAIESRERLARLAPLVVRVVGLWVLAGAFAKLFLGTPADLPGPVRAFFLGPDLTFKLAIAVELCVAGLALLHPRFAWPPLALLLLVFVGILGNLVAAGESSCGCFGSRITIHPAVMLAVDGTGLLALLASKPWATIPPSGLRLGWLAPTFAMAIAAPWLVLPAAAETPPPRDPALGWTPPRGLPRYVSLEPRKWIGSPIRETPLGWLIDTDQYPGFATWILYRLNCPVCAKHLRELATHPDPEVPYVLVRLPEPNDEKEKVVDLKPPGMEVSLPEGTVYAITTPWELRLEGGAVVAASEVAH